MIPKISAVLNNCGLHALTPEIQQEIKYYAKKDHHTTPYNAEYNLLKQTFAQFYEFKSLTWKQFSQILSSYNAHDVQIILGPVLRAFMEHSNDKNALHLSDFNLSLEELTRINPNTARYECLDPESISRYVAKRLGIELVTHDNDHSQRVYHCDSKPRATAHLYHFGTVDEGHWEKTSDPKKHADVQLAEKSQFKSLVLLLGKDLQLNEFVFLLLKKHVQCTAKASKTSKADIEKTAREIQSYTETSFDQTFHYSNDEYLAAFESQLTPDSIQFIRSYQPKPVAIHWDSDVHSSDHSNEKSVSDLKEDCSSSSKSAQKEEDTHISFFSLFDERDENSQPETIVPVKQAFPQFKQQFDKQLILLADKKTNLLNRKEMQGFQAADNLHTQLKKYSEIFYNSDSKNVEEAKNRFIEQSSKAIRQAHKTLDQHRGWSEFLTNLTLGIFTLGLGLAIKGAYNSYNNRNLFWVHDTQSKTILDNITMCINEIKTN